MKQETPAPGSALTPPHVQASGPTMRRGSQFWPRERSIRWGRLLMLGGRLRGAGVALKVRDNQLSLGLAATQWSALHVTGAPGKQKDAPDVLGNPEPTRNPCGVQDTGGRRPLLYTWATAMAATELLDMAGDCAPKRLTMSQTLQCDFLWFISVNLSKQESQALAYLQPPPPSRFIMIIKHLEHSQQVLAFLHRPFQARHHQERGGRGWGQVACHLPRASAVVCGREPRPAHCHEVNQAPRESQKPIKTRGKTALRSPGLPGQLRPAPASPHGAAPSAPGHLPPTAETLMPLSSLGSGHRGRGGRGTAEANSSRILDSIAVRRAEKLPF
uniref:Uncharacterized protein n=1 Tax=Rangifer tarandus platyrhynchus TaxID=3082113 RepID=A0ACB0E894_RANTA|nr:unnamed protein product [Rangifer tarandus platyrhynchus]